MLSVIGFLIILGPLVVVHEFGHYFFARLFNVKAEVFSIGFGPRLWSRQLGETELRISIIPLGGFVKLLGEDRDSELSPEEQKRALHRQVPWKRFFIFSGGAIFNFIFAILIFMTILAIGEPQVASVIGRVVRGSPAAKAGFLSGDRILSVDGKKVKRYEDMLNLVNEKPGRAMDFEVIHPSYTLGAASAPAHLEVTPAPQSGYSVYGEQKPVGEIDGFLPAGRGTLIGISNPDSPAAKAGIKTKDQVVEFNGMAIENWEVLEALYAKALPNTSIRLKIKKPENAPSVEVALTKPATEQGMEEAWGLRSSELFVEKPVLKSPAEAAGIRQGDRLIGVGPVAVQSFFDLKDAVQKSGEKTGKVPIHWERDGKELIADLSPTSTDGRDPVMKKTTQFTIGVMPMLSLAEPVMVTEKIYNPFMLMVKGTERMVVLSWRNLVSIGKMFTGDVSVGTLGGPILIGKIAGESLTRGLIAFLTTMGILSIGLGVLNILPVPVLDGGHLMLLGVEAIRGKPLTVRQMEIIQGVGLVLILALMGIVLKNDISRLPYF